MEEEKRMKFKQKKKVQKNVELQKRRNYKKISRKRNEKANETKFQKRKKIQKKN